MGRKILYLALSLSLTACVSSVSESPTTAKAPSWEHDKMVAAGRGSGHPLKAYNQKRYKIAKMMDWIELSKK